MTLRRLLFFTLLCPFVFALILFILMQTAIPAQQLTAYLLNASAQEDIDMTIEGLKTSFPFRCTIDRMQLHTKKGTEISLEDLNAKISLLSLLRSKLSLQWLSIERLSFITSQSSPSLSLNLPFDISAKRLVIGECITEHLSFSMRGSVRLHHRGEEIMVDLTFQDLQEKGTLTCKATSSKKNALFTGFLHLHLDTTLLWDSSLTWHAPWPWQTLLDPHAIDPLHIDWSLVANSKDQEFLQGDGSFYLSPTLTPLQGDLAISCSNLAIGQSLFQALPQGACTLRLTCKDSTVHGSLSSAELLWKELPPLGILLNIDAKVEQTIWKGTSKLHLFHDTISSQGCAFFSWSPDALYIEDAEIALNNHPWISGHLSCLQSTWAGEAILHTLDIKPLRSLFPSSLLEGKLGGSFSWKGAHYITHLLGKNMRYQAMSVDQAELFLETTAEHHVASATMTLEGKELVFPQGRLSRFSLSGNPISPGEHELSLAIEGIANSPFSLYAHSTLCQQASSFTIHLTDYRGTLGPYTLSGSPWSYQQQEDTFHLQGGPLYLGDGSLTLTSSVHKESALFDIHAIKLPLSLLSCYFPGYAFHGALSMNGHLASQDGFLCGSLLATFEDLPMQTKGSLQLHCTKERSQLYTYFHAPQGQFLEGSFTFPLLCQYDPFIMTIPSDASITGDVSIEGTFEELYSYLQSSSQEIRGWLAGQFFVHGSFNDPFCQGALSWKQGTYHNYSLGTKLSNIEGIISATQMQIDLHASGTDFEIGTFTFSGNAYLKNHLPYHYDAHLMNLLAVHNDTLSLQASGELHGDGSLQHSEVSGSLCVHQATFTLSDALFTEIPTLPICYIHKPIHLEQHQEILADPLSLHIHLTAQDNIHIQGKGLDSEWFGDLTLLGTSDVMQSDGALSLKQGKYLFAGKTFTLTQGRVSFFENEEQEALVTLTGELSLPETTILVFLQGALSHPSITFQSIPPLPTSSILSLILFQKELSEITPVQAIQLAQVIVSLSGSGPDVLEAIRKTLGVDRLTIAEKEETDEVAVQIGWYLTHGITVSLIQSATSSDVTIEVDLKNGFVFEAETQNQEEGKFSLKWHKRY